MPETKKRQKLGAMKKKATKARNLALPPVPDPKVINSLIEALSEMSHLSEGAGKNDSVAAAQDIIYDA